MKSLRIRLIRGLIAATVIAADEQALHLEGMNKADNQGFGGLMGKPRPDWRWRRRISHLKRVTALLVVGCDSKAGGWLRVFVRDSILSHAPCY